MEEDVIAPPGLLRLLLFVDGNLIRVGGAIYVMLSYKNDFCSRPKRNRPDTVPTLRGYSGVTLNIA